MGSTSPDVACYEYDARAAHADPSAVHADLRRPLRHPLRHVSTEQLANRNLASGSLTPATDSSSECCSDVGAHVTCRAWQLKHVLDREPQQELEPPATSAAIEAQASDDTARDSIGDYSSNEHMTLHDGPDAIMSKEIDVRLPTVLEPTNTSTAAGSQVSGNLIKRDTSLVDSIPTPPPKSLAGSKSVQKACSKPFRPPTSLKSAPSRIVDADNKSAKAKSRLQAEAERLHGERAALLAAFPLHLLPPSLSPEESDKSNESNGKEKGKGHRSGTTEEQIVRAAREVVGRRLAALHAYNGARDAAGLLVARLAQARGIAVGQAWEDCGFADEAGADGKASG